ncbi:MAG: carbonic anhydrase [Candidatus Dormibacteria bacterium]
MITVASVSAIPSQHLAVITCMDARIDPFGALGLEPGAAHVLRNAGALVTDDVLRSLVLSQRLLQTRSVTVMAHTDCGLRSLRDAEVAREIEAETGAALPFALGSFSDLEQHVRDQVTRVRSCPWLRHTDDVRGCILDVADGTVREVD